MAGGGILYPPDANQSAIRSWHGAIASNARARTHKSRLFGDRWLPRATCADGAKVNDGPIDIDGGFKNCLDSFVAHVSLCRCLNGFWAWLPYHIRPQLRFSGDLPPPSPPAEKATARQDQVGQPGADDRTWCRRRLGLIDRLRRRRRNDRRRQWRRWWRWQTDRRVIATCRRHGRDSDHLRARRGRQMHDDGR